MTFETPRHLSGNAATGLAAWEPVAQFELGTQRNFVYLLLDWTGAAGKRRAAIIDPQADIETPLKALAANGFELAAVLITHSHSDHTAGVGELMNRFPEVPVYVHDAEAKRLRKKLPDAARLQRVEDGSVIRVGSLAVRTVHTPGHSAGECCYLFLADRHYLFTGDMVFIGDCGRTDLDTGDTGEMFASLQKLRKLAGEIGDAVILPGHHYAQACTSTLQKELRESPPFQCRSVQDLQRLP